MMPVLLSSSCLEAQLMSRLSFLLRGFGRRTTVVLFHWHLTNPHWSSLTIQQHVLVARYPLTGWPIFWAPGDWRGCYPLTHSFSELKPPPFFGKGIFRSWRNMPICSSWGVLLTGASNIDSSGALRDQFCLRSQTQRDRDFFFDFCRNVPKLVSRLQQSS